MPHPRSTTMRVLGQLLLTVLRLTAVGFLAIGASGLVAELMGGAFGHGFVAGDPPGVTYTRARCAEFSEYAPRNFTCEQAATYHHFGEVVQYRIAAGILGLVLFGAYWLLNRRKSVKALLPAGFDLTVATTMFGVVALLLLGESLNALMLGLDAGVGAYLSAGMVSLTFAVAFGIPLLRTLLGSVSAGRRGLDRHA